MTSIVVQVCMSLHFYWPTNNAERFGGKTRFLYSKYFSIDNSFSEMPSKRSKFQRTFQ